MILFSKSWKSQSLTGSSTQLFSKYSSPRLSCAVAKLTIPTFWFQLDLNCNLLVWNWPWKPRFPPPCVDPCLRSCTLPLPRWTLLTWTIIFAINKWNSGSVSYSRLHKTFLERTRTHLNQLFVVLTLDPFYLLSSLQLSLPKIQGTDFLCPLPLPPSPIAFNNYQQLSLNGRNSKKRKSWRENVRKEDYMWQVPMMREEATQLQEVQCDLLDWHIHLPSSARYHDYKFVQRRLGKNLSIYPRGDSGEPHSYDLLLQNFELLLISFVKIFWCLGGKSDIRPLW